MLLLPVLLLGRLRKGAWEQLQNSLLRRQAIAFPLWRWAAGVVRSFREKDAIDDRSSSPASLCSSEELLLAATLMRLTSIDTCMACAHEDATVAAVLLPGLLLLSAAGVSTATTASVLPPAWVPAATALPPSLAAAFSSSSSRSACSAARSVLARTSTAHSGVAVVGAATLVAVHTLEDGREKRMAAVAFEPAPISTTRPAGCPWLLAPVPDFLKGAEGGE